MYLTFLIYFLFLMVVNVFCKDALKYFLEHKKIQNFSMEILKTSENNTKDWVEYKYIFDTRPAIGNSSLKVILMFDDDSFDCSMGKNDSNFKGYSVDTVENLKEFLNLSIEYSTLSDGYNTSDIEENINNLYICHTSIRNLDSNNIIELFPTLQSNHFIIYKPNKLRFTKDIFILTFAGYLWLIFLIVLIVLAICLRISTQQYSMISPKHESWTWVEITLWAIAAACQQGLSHTPSGFASCCIFLLGYLMAYLLYTGFAAAITSILVQHVDNTFNFETMRSGDLQLIILQQSQSHTNMIKNNFVILQYEGYNLDFTMTHLQLRRFYVNDLELFFNELDKKDRIGVAPGILINQYLANNFNDRQISEFSFYKLNIPKYSQGFLIHRDNPFKNVLNKQIIKMEQTGILQNMLKRNLRVEQMVDFNSGYSSAGQEHVGSAILIFLSGVLASLIFLMAEFVFKFYQRSRNRLGI